MSVRATIIVPTFDHGPTLRYSVTSALRQTVSDIEVMILGDGVPQSARNIISGLLREDSRIQFFDHSKHESRGEVHRHAVMARAQGRIVCYLADDDLYFPDHIQTMLDLLTESQFAHAYPLRVMPDGTVRDWTINLALAEHRKLLIAGENRVATSAAGHTLSMYQRLPEGWQTPPAGVPTDLFMWQKFLRQLDCRFASGTLPSVLVFPSPLRRDWTIEARVAELAKWARWIQDPAWRLRLHQQLLRQKVLQSARLDARFLEAKRLLREMGQVLAEPIETNGIHPAG